MQVSDPMTSSTKRCHTTHKTRPLTAQAQFMAVSLIVSGCPVPPYAASAGLSCASLDSYSPGLSGGRPRELQRGDPFITDTHCLWCPWLSPQRGVWWIFNDIKDLSPVAGTALMCPWDLGSSVCLPSIPLSSREPQSCHKGDHEHCICLFVIFL